MGTQKEKEIVINKCFGGFSISRKAFLRLRELKNEHAKREPDVGEYYEDGSGPRRDHSFDAFCRGIPRDDAQLVQVVRELGEEADGIHANLVIVAIPNDVEWEIDEYDGMEHIAEKHRTWG